MFVFDLGSSHFGSSRPSLYTAALLLRCSRFQAALTMAQWRPNGQGRDFYGYWQPPYYTKGGGKGGGKGAKKLAASIWAAQVKAAQEAEVAVRAEAAKKKKKEAAAKAKAKKEEQGAVPRSGKGKGKILISSPVAGDKTSGTVVGDNHITWYCWECHGENFTFGLYCKKKVKGVACGHPNLAVVAPDLRAQKIKEWEQHKAKQLEKSGMILGAETHKKIVTCNSFAPFEEKDAAEPSEDAEMAAEALTEEEKEELQAKLKKIKDTVTNLTCLGCAIPAELTKEQAEIDDKLGNDRDPKSVLPTLAQRREVLQKAQDSLDKQNKALQEKQEKITKDEETLEKRRKKLREDMHKVQTYEAEYVQPLKDAVLAMTKKELEEEGITTPPPAQSQPPVSLQAAIEANLIQGTDLLNNQEYLAKLTPEDLHKVCVNFGGLLQFAKGKLADASKDEAMSQTLQGLGSLLTVGQGVMRPQEEDQEALDAAKRGCGAATPVPGGASQSGLEA